MMRMERGEGYSEPSGTGLAQSWPWHNRMAHHKAVDSAGLLSTAVSDHSSAEAGFITCVRVVITVLIWATNSYTMPQTHLSPGPA